MLDAVISSAWKEYGMAALPYLLLAWSIRNNLKLQKDTTTAITTVAKSMESLEKWVSLSVTIGKKQ